MFLVTTGTAGVIDINGTIWVELVTFVVMVAVLARWVYPVIVRQAEARQRAIAEQLRDAEKARSDAQKELEEARAKLEDARKTAQEVIDAAAKSGQQLRQEMKDRAEEEAKRIAEAARKTIDVERDKAVQAVRGEVAGLVVAATEKVIGETLDLTKHRQLIERAISEVGSGDGSR